MTLSTEGRAAIHAALSDPVRLAIVDELTVADRSPVELRRRFGIESNLLAHHLDVLEDVDLIERSRSSGDGRRRYVHLRRIALDGIGPGRRVGVGPAVFICSANSARSQLAAAIWQKRTGQRATSAGTHPAERVHPGAVAAARRAGLDIGDAQPKALSDASLSRSLVVTVCDRAHEELESAEDWLHWSVPDPVPVNSKAAFDAVVAELDQRIAALVAS